LRLVGPLVGERPHEDVAARQHPDEAARETARHLRGQVPAVELPELVVRKRSGTVRPFSRHKVLEGMGRAAKSRVPIEDLERATVLVEAAIRDLGVREVTSEQVGLQVLAQLKELDPVSYVRFASVYKDFQGPEDFEHELKVLRKDAPPKSA
jgi:transcriptional repressor NrdR